MDTETPLASHRGPVDAPTLRAVDVSVREESARAQRIAAIVAAFDVAKEAAPVALRGRAGRPPRRHRGLRRCDRRHPVEDRHRERRATREQSVGAITPAAPPQVGSGCDRLSDRRAPLMPPWEPCRCSVPPLPRRDARDIATKSNAVWVEDPCLTSQRDGWPQSAAPAERQRQHARMCNLCGCLERRSSVPLGFGTALLRRRS